MEGHVCFLCEKHNSTSELRQAMTMQLDKRLNECALNLNKLKYHYSCLTALSIENQDNSELPQEKEVYSLVFSEFVTYIMETKTSSDNSVVFRLADLVSFYKQRLEQLGMKTPDVNSTRLKEKLLAEIPELESHKKGRGFLLAFKKGAVLSQASNYSEAITLAKAAKILRGHMIDHKPTFAGTFHEGYVEYAIPSTLLQFVCMIEHGVDIKSQLRFGASKTDLAMAQFLQYNCYAKYREETATYRHSKDHETPFAVFIGMSLYATRGSVG